ncbi:MAG TPA: hypothetical protein VJV05_04310 [Pyrinomonadaceae bacterium]|nr:hypothetical protein [Pyrinomonadaceae bacterium]
MRFLFLALLAILLTGSVGIAQPGDDGTLSVTIVDKSNQPIRGARVAEAGPGNGQTTFLSRIFSDAASRGFKPLFKPRDAERSSYIADMRCWRGQKFAIKVSAEGYEPLVIADTVSSCEQELRAELKRDGSPLPALDPLFVLKGRLSDQNGRPITRRFLIVREGVEFVPRISANGDYVVKLTPGFYEIRFEEFGCTEHVIKNYKIADRSRTLDFTVDCQ